MLLDAIRSAVVRMLSSLEYREYRTLWYANMWAGAAAWALIVARGVLVLDLADSSALVGVTTFAAMFPVVFVPVIAGYLSDRMDRRTVLAWTFGINLVHNVALAALVILGQAEVWQIIALSLVNGAARAAQMPASQALVSTLVPPDQLLNALALNQATLHGSRLVGPLLVAPLLATVGPGWAFALCTVFYLIGLLQVLRLPARAAEDASPERASVRDLFAGFGYVYRHPLLRAVTWLVLLHCALTMSFESMLPDMSQNVLHFGRAGVSYMMMAVGAGALVGTLFIGAIRDPVQRGQMLWITGLLSGLTCVAMGVTENVWIVMSASIAMGASQSGFMTLTSAVVQMAAPNALRGRVISIYLLHAVGMMAFANLGSGAASEGVHMAMEGMHGPPVVFVVCGILFTLVMIGSTRSPILAALYAGKGWDGNTPDFTLGPTKAEAAT